MGRGPGDPDATQAVKVVKGIEQYDSKANISCRVDKCTPIMAAKNCIHRAGAQSIMCNAAIQPQ